MENQIQINPGNIAEKIYFIRGEKVILDFDLASLYNIEAKRLKEAVRRNRKRFPVDFMFELTKNEHENLRTQFASSSWGGQRYIPYAFTEQGVAMLSGTMNFPETTKWGTYLPAVRLTQAPHPHWKDEKSKPASFRTRSTTVITASSMVCGLL